MLLALWSVLAELAPWLLLGASIAGLLHVWLPADFIHRHLNGRWGVLKAAAIGVPMPLCSCGVIPTGLGLKKDGASDGAVVAFLISTPQTGVDSILVSASFLGLPFALFKVVSAFVTGLVGGWITDAVVASPAPPVPQPEDGEACAVAPPGPAYKRAVEHALELLQTTWRWMVFGVVVSALLSHYVPPDALASLSAGGGVLAYLGVLAVAVPLYVCATASVPIAAALVGAGMPVGAALVFLMAGPATNVATLGAVYRTLGARALGAYLGTILVGSVSLGMLAEPWLTPTVGQAHHHHHELAWWAHASAALLLALMVWFAVQSARAWWSRHRLAKLPALEVGVEGMKCGGCAGRLQRALQDAQGVAQAAVSLETRKARVQGSISEARLRELIQQAGFKAV
jgi:uncharacterized membrane protein YraQ (UPF0718 family)/copper chaperone CopZ